MKAVRHTVVLVVLLAATGASLFWIKRPPNLSAHTYAALGNAQDTCLEWQEQRRAGSAQYDTVIVQGFVTGQNYYATRDYARKIGLDVPEIEQWLDAYCQKNPGHRVVDAAAALVEQRGGADALRPWKR
jgi:hypothetical protein